MTKAEAIAMQNRLEYLKDKADRQDKEIDRFKKGMAELQMAADIMLMQVAYLYGGKGKKIKLRPIPDLKDWDAQISRNDGTKEITVKLVPKDK